MWEREYVLHAWCVCVTITIKEAVMNLRESKRERKFRGKWEEWVEIRWSENDVNTALI